MTKRNRATRTTLALSTQRRAPLTFLSLSRCKQTLTLATKLTVPGPPVLKLPRAAWAGNLGRKKTHLKTKKTRKAANNLLHIFLALHYRTSALRLRMSDRSEQLQLWGFSRKGKARKRKRKARSMKRSLRCTYSALSLTMVTHLACQIGQSSAPFLLTAKPGLRFTVVPFSRSRSRHRRWWMWYPVGVVEKGIRQCRSPAWWLVLMFMPCKV